MLPCPVYAVGAYRRAMSLWIRGVCCCVSVCVADLSLLFRVRVLMCVRVWEQVVMSKEHWRREDEPMADFLAKKREMFLVQMALDTKREEIAKLEQKAQMKEAAIKKSELLLEEVCGVSVLAVERVRLPSRHPCGTLCAQRGGGG